MENAPKVETKSASSQPLIISYLTLRKFIGWLGFSLPFVLGVGGIVIDFNAIKFEPSISDYYYSTLRDVFVGVLFSISVFLMSYRGYDKKDHNASLLAGLCVLGVALFPTSPVCNPLSNELTVGMFHYVFVAGYFLTLSYISIFLFTKTHVGAEATRTPKKLQRNNVYIVCGVLMILSLAAIGLNKLLNMHVDLCKETSCTVFLLESIAVLAFGVSWLTKGELILKDE